MGIVDSSVVKSVFYLPDIWGQREDPVYFIPEDILLDQEHQSKLQSIGLIPGQPFPVSALPGATFSSSYSSLASSKAIKKLWHINEDSFRIEQCPSIKFRLSSSTTQTFSSNYGQFLYPPPSFSCYGNSLSHIKHKFINVKNQSQFNQHVKSLTTTAFRLFFTYSSSYPLSLTIFINVKFEEVKSRKGLTSSISFTPEDSASSSPSGLNFTKKIYKSSSILLKEGENISFDSLEHNILFDCRSLPSFILLKKKKKKMKMTYDFVLHVEKYDNKKIRENEKEKQINNNNIIELDKIKEKEKMLLNNSSSFTIINSSNIKSHYDFTSYLYSSFSFLSSYLFPSTSTSSSSVMPLSLIENEKEKEKNKDKSFFSQFSSSTTISPSPSVEEEHNVLSEILCVRLDLDKATAPLTSPYIAVLKEHCKNNSFVHSLPSFSTSTSNSATASSPLSPPSTSPHLSPLLTERKQLDTYSPPSFSNPSSTSEPSSFDVSVPPPPSSSIYTSPSMLKRRRVKKRNKKGIYPIPPSLPTIMESDETTFTSNSTVFSSITRGAMDDEDEEFEDEIEELENNNKNISSPSENVSTPLDDLSTTRSDSPSLFLDDEDFDDIELEDFDLEEFEMLEISDDDDDDDDEKVNESSKAQEVRQVTTSITSISPSTSSLETTNSSSPRSSSSHSSSTYLSLSSSTLAYFSNDSYSRVRSFSNDSEDSYEEIEPSENILDFSTKLRSDSLDYIEKVDNLGKNNSVDKYDDSTFSDLDFNREEEENKIENNNNDNKLENNMEGDDYDEFKPLLLVPLQISTHYLQMKKGLYESSPIYGLPLPYTTNTPHDSSSIFLKHSSSSSSISTLTPTRLLSEPCVVCLSAPRSVMLYPCRHCSLCLSCAHAMVTMLNKAQNQRQPASQGSRTCPQCRKGFTLLLQFK